MSRERILKIGKVVFGVPLQCWNLQKIIFDQFFLQRKSLTKATKGRKRLCKAPQKTKTEIQENSTLVSTEEDPSNFTREFSRE